MTQHPTDPYTDPVAVAGTRSTERSGAHAPAATGGSGSSTASAAASTAKEQAAGVGQEAKASTQHVAGVAKDQAGDVVHHAGQQARDLLHQGRGQLHEQAGAQQQKAAGQLRSLSDEFRALASGEGGSGVAADLVHQASSRLGSAAGWLESREPRDLLEEVASFARRRPGTFLAVAAGVGLLAGRLSRGVAANVKEEHESQQQAQALRSSTGYGAGYPATTTGTTTRTTGDSSWAIPGDEADPALGTSYRPAAGTPGESPLTAPDDRAVYGRATGRSLP